MDGRSALVVVAGLAAGLAGSGAAVAQGPASAASPIQSPARIPPSPLSVPPVGNVTVDPIRESINGGSTLSTGPVARPSWFRRAVPTPRRRDRNAPEVPPRPVRKPAVDPDAEMVGKTDPDASPTSLVDGANLTPAALAPPAQSPAGRPAPYANQVPASARVQAVPAAGSLGGPRPAPYAHEVPARPRPQAPPRAPITAAPLPTAAEEPTPSPPPLDPVSAPRAEVSPEPPAVDPPPVAVAETSAEPPDSPASGSTTMVATAPTGADAPPTIEPLATTPKPVDLNLIPASMEQMASVKSNLGARSAPVASRRAASVGTEVITMHELEQAVNDMIESVGNGQKPDHDTLNRVAAQVLDTLIDEALIIQEANRKIGKSAKSQDMFNKYAEQRFREEELAPMLRKTSSANEFELNNKLVAEKGKTVEDLRAVFRRKLTAREFLYQEIKSRISADFSDMRAYYNSHLANYERPALNTWREIEVSIGKSPDRAAARARIDAIAARLAREDFATVARAVSDGPTASKGGLWETSPGGFGVPAVNAAVDSLPVGRVSDVIESPTSFHLIRVDERREAGPARFDEVQDQIREEVFQRNFARARDNYLQKLRKTTVVVTIFDQTASDPGRARRPDEAR